MEGAYYKTKASVEEYIKLAKGVHGGELIEKFKQVLQPNSCILEIGSGPGTDWEILNESFTVIGSDNSAEFLKHLIAKNPNDKFLDLDAITLITDKRFDGIYANKVMHHLNASELATSIKRQYDILKPNGIICLSFWKGEGSEIFKGLFVNYHTKGTLKKAFQNYFEILTIDAYNEFEDGDSLLVLARKK